MLSMALLPSVKPESVNSGFFNGVRGSPEAAFVDKLKRNKSKYRCPGCGTRLTALKKESEYTLNGPPSSNLCDINKRPLVTSSPNVLHTRSSNANATDRQWNSPPARLNNVKASCIWQKASNRLTRRSENPRPSGRGAVKQASQCS